ncbi:MAG: hypothetical protein GX177_05480 [Firmicutes bacterium]|nr:hypothetical protein [Bacillota bacterium]
MKFFRYRKPSAKTVLGITKAKKRIKKQTGITAATRPLRAVSNAKRRAKRKIGYYSTPARMVRAKKPPTPMGCLLPATVVILLGILFILN